ncbi:ABC-three component system middle component 1 [uncultured Chryseobacterium sp.]|uniref:ABC-three component system middle component 1 n=1 Tax=uncultured Chryseobacterium sp. TaxID=259322 RepID=UPI00258A6EBD|nr:ABC-three component system middle component 1 [uncultured Chryseobacterium sp.]
MITIINNLLLQLELLSTPLEFGLLYSFKDSTKKSYWLVTEEENLTTVIDKQTDYFEHCRGILNNEWFDKNANLLILHKVDEINEKIHQQVLKVEEDPYLFKKQVLLYKDEEVEKLTEILNTENITLKEFLDLNLLTDKVYEIHKNQINNNNWESLIYRIAQKIPIIRLNISRSNGLSVLIEENKQKVDVGNYKEINSLLENIFFQKSSEEILEIDNDLIFNLLNGKENEN